MKTKKSKALGAKPVAEVEEKASMDQENTVAEEEVDVAEPSIATVEPETSKKGKKRPLKSEKTDDGNSDEEIVAEESVAKKKKLGSYNEKMTDDELKRTIFVGNLPMGVTRKDVDKLFSPCGAIESSRIRSIVPSKDKLWKKIAAIKNEMSTEFKDSINAYVKFKEVASVEKALQMNGNLFSNRRLQVDSCSKALKYDSKRSVFVGNMPFKCTEDNLIAHFSDCGDIERVRIVRDSKTGAGKGFGFVVFKDASAAGLALKLNGEKFEDRPLRVTRIVKKFGKQKTLKIKEKKKQKETTKSNDGKNPTKENKTKKNLNKKHKIQKNKKPLSFME